MQLIKLFALCINLVIMLVIAQFSHASMITYEVSGVISNGDLIGESLSGYFTIDSDPGLDVVQYKPLGNDSDGILLSMRIEIDGNIFEVTDEIGFPFRPVVVFYQGGYTAI